MSDEPIKTTDMARSGPRMIPEDDALYATAKTQPLPPVAPVKQKLPG